MDDFQSATPGSAPASWTVENGSWTVQQEGTTSGGLPNDVLAQGSPSTAGDYTITAGSSAWTNYTVQARVKPGANDLYQPNDLMARFTNDDNHYSFLLKNNDEWYLGKRVDGTWTTLAQGTYSYSSRFYTLKMTLNGAAITAAIDGKVVATVNDTSFASGKIGFLTSAESALDDVVVTAPGAPIPTTPKPTPKGAACVEVVKGSLTMGTCDGTFTPVFSLSSNGGAVCVEDTNGIMMLGTCSGTFTAKS
jgi:pectate lyase